MKLEAQTLRDVVRERDASMSRELRGGSEQPSVQSRKHEDDALNCPPVLNLLQDLSQLVTQSALPLTPLRGC